MEDLIIKYIGNIGVPAALCFYIIFTLNKSVNNLTDIVKDFTKAHSSQLDRIENNSKLLIEIIRNKELTK